MPDSTTGAPRPDWPTKDDFARMTAAEVNAFFESVGSTWRVKDFEATTGALRTLRDRLFDKYAGAKGPYRGVKADVLALIYENDRLEREAADIDVDRGAKFLQDIVGAVPWDDLLEHEREVRREQVRAYNAGDPHWFARLRASDTPKEPTNG